jgi:hypothetical protein
MKRQYDVENVRFEGENLFLTIDGEEKKFHLNEVSSLLESASEEERNTFEISPSGYGITWPLLDEDISIDGLLGIAHSPSQKRKIA